MESALLLISGYLRRYAMNPNTNIPLDIIGIVQQFEPKLIWRSEVFGNVGGGSAYEHEFDGPITALKFNHAISNGKHILIHGYKVEGSANMNDIKIGCQTSGEEHDVIMEFDGNVIECTVYWGGWLNSVKGLQFRTDSGENYSIGHTTDSYNMHKNTVKPPFEGYALCGFHGGSGWFMDSIGCIFVAI